MRLERYLEILLFLCVSELAALPEHHHKNSWRVIYQAISDLDRGLGDKLRQTVFKDAMLGRFYAICNCCSCCCGAMNAHRNGTPMLASSGYVAQVDVDLCAGCGECADVCQFAAISVDDGFARIDATACMGCGVCVAHCPQEAIDLVRDLVKGEPLEIQRLIGEAAVAV